MERDFRWVYSGTQGGGGGRGRDALRAMGLPGHVPSPLPPFPFSPSLPPEGGVAAPAEIYFCKEAEATTEAGHSFIGC